MSGDAADLQTVEPALKGMASTVGSPREFFDKALPVLKRHAIVHCPEQDRFRVAPGQLAEQHRPAGPARSRVLGEFDDDRTWFVSHKSRKNYAATSPIIRVLGRRHVVLARLARNRRLADALEQRAFAPSGTLPAPAVTTTNSAPAARPTHQALRQLANRWVGILHICSLPPSETTLRPHRFMAQLL
jgi:hypothetical protein